MRILITGGAGFIASHFIERVVHENEVIVYDNFTRDAIQFTSLSHHHNVNLVEGDVLDSSKLSEAMRGVDICIHAAAVAGIYSVDESAVRTMKVNFMGVYNALEACMKNKVKRFIGLSTSEVYGPSVYKGKEKDCTTLGPIGKKRWIYAVSKLAAEHFAHAYRGEYGLEVITIRPFNVYGPRQVGEGAIQQMVRIALKDEDIVVYNDGTQIRAWCYITDFVDALDKIVNIANSECQVFNIGNPQATITVLSLAEKILRMCGSKSKVIFEKHPGAEVELRVPDISYARRVLGFHPEVSLEDGLRRTIGWYRSQMETG